MAIEAMRAAVIAIRAGAFDTRDDVGSAIDDRTSGSSRPARTSTSVGAGLPWTGGDVGAPVVLVLAAHAGAGASTVALAVAEGLADARRVQLVEYAEPARSGLVAACGVELGADGPWWRRGRRGGLDVFRLARRLAEAGLPLPPEADGAERLLVVDAGWSLTAALLESGLLGASPHGQQVVVATRVTVPAVRQTEHLLAATGCEAVVAVVGPARWPREVEAGCGPLLRRLRSRGRMVRVPVDRRLEAAGLTSDRLPRSVAAAGRSLAALLVPVVPPQPRHWGGAPSPRYGAAGETR
jgi:hypothetical protein